MNQEEMTGTPEGRGLGEAAEVIYIDADGRYVDEHGYYVDQHGYYVDQDGNYLVDGYYVDEQGQHLDDHGNVVVDPVVPADGDDIYLDDISARGGPQSRAEHRRRAIEHQRRTGERRRRPVLSVVVVAMAVLIVVALLEGVHLSHEINPGGRPGRTVSVTVPSGSSSAQIGSILAKAGVIHGPSLFRYYVKLQGAGPLLPGSYQLATNEKYGAVVSALEAGPVQVLEKLTIPEGFTMAQVAARLATIPKLHLSAEKFLAAANAGQVRSPYEPAGVNDLEGLLFPATYTIKQGANETDVLQMLVDAFDQEATTLGLAKGAATLGMTPYQLVTVASIVEREAKLDGDRGNVASSIYNRLKAHMSLGADSTLVYELRKTNPNLSINAIDYNQANPYNTRLNKGLPPTPIANPGVPSLTAAINPPQTSYLYFVEVNPSGQLGFASTNAGFSQLETQCRASHLC